MVIFHSYVSLPEGNMGLLETGINIVLETSVESRKMLRHISKNICG